MACGAQAVHRLTEVVRAEHGRQHLVSAGRLVRRAGYLRQVVLVLGERHLVVGEAAAERQQLAVQVVEASLHGRDGLLLGFERCLGGTGGPLSCMKIRL